MELTLQRERAGITFRAFYFSFFFGIGAMLPLLGVYLQQTIHLSGSQIGNITSLGPVVMILMQPLWGVLSDYTQKPKQILLFTLFITAITGFSYSLASTYGIFIIIAIALSIGQSAIGPLSDSLALTYAQKRGGNYGSIRLYGAVGFAVAVLVAGRASEYFGTTVIFYLFGGMMLLSMVFTFAFPTETETSRGDMKEGARYLLKKREFVVFLCSTFLIFGPIFANNTYFGLFITHIGGSLTGVGLAFLLAAGSEAPFMQLAASWIRKLGVTRILVIASVISALRWAFYYFDPPLVVVYATTISQGLSIGLFVPAALQYVRELAPSSMQSTAVALYTTAGSGFGTWFCTFVGGFLMERFGIANVYLFFAILTCIGIALFVFELRINKKRYSLS